MKAAVYHGQADIRVETVPDPIAGPGEVILEVGVTGVCGTDAAEYAHGPRMFPINARHPASGHLGPMIPGHEFAGRVLQVPPDVTGLRVGEWVVTGAGVSCGECARCRAGRLNLCTRYWTLGLQRDGGLAQYCAVPASSCVRAEPFGLAGDVLGLAQPMSIAVHSMRQGRSKAGETALVIGVGGIGAFLVSALVQTGLQVVVTDLDADRRDVARDLGAEHALDPREVPIEEAVLDLGLDIDVVFEVSGTSAGFASALAVLPTAARLVAVSLHERPREIDVRRLTLRENELIGTNAHVVTLDMPTALGFLAARDRGWSDLAPVALPLERLVDEALVPLVEGRSGQVKTLIDPWTDVARATLMPGGPAASAVGSPTANVRSATNQRTVAS